MNSKHLLLVVLGLCLILQGSDTKSKKKQKSEEGSESGSCEIDPVAECSKTYDIEAVHSVKIQGGQEESCEIILLGSPKCTPELRCKQVKINGEGADCDETYLEISDGWGGSRRICGKAKLAHNGIRASKGARDLFVNIKGHKGGKVVCEAVCGSKKQGKGHDLLTVTKKKKYDNRCVCGIQNRDDRIVGGEDAKRFEFPWQVAIVAKGTRSPTCGAALINDRFILTATHCFWFSNTTAGQIDVLLHSHLLDMTLEAGWKDGVELGQKGSIRGRGWDAAKVSDEAERTVRLEIQEIIMHPLFTEGYDYDVALLRLKNPVDLSTVEATPICLPHQNDHQTFVGAIPTVVGWGKPDEKASSTTRLLQKLDVPVLDINKCAKMMQMKLTGRMMCAGYEEGNKDACTGDSGGPLSLKGSKNQFTQIGVVSWGEGCARKNRPGMYSRVTDMIDFIEYHTLKANAIWCRDSVGEKEE